MESRLAIPNDHYYSKTGESAVSPGYTYSLGLLRPGLLLTTHCDPLENHKSSLMSYNQPLKKNKKQDRKFKVQHTSTVEFDEISVSLTDTYMCVGTECEHISSMT